MELCFLVLESDPILARTLNRVLSRHANVRVEHSPEAAKRALDETQAWCALFFNAFLPRGDGVDVLEHARKRGCYSPAVTIATTFDPRIAHRAFELGSHYVLDIIAPDSIGAFAQRLLSSARHAGPSDALERWSRAYQLSRSEHAILREAVAGAVHKDIASFRDVSSNTLKRQIRNLLRKTGDASLRGAALRLLRETETQV